MFCCLYITVEIYPKKVIIPLNSQLSILNSQFSTLNFLKEKKQ